MPINTIVTLELSLVTVIFEISVLELVKIACCQKSDKSARGCHILGSCVPVYEENQKKKNFATSALFISLLITY